MCQNFANFILLELFWFWIEGNGRFWDFLTFYVPLCSKKLSVHCVPIVPICSAVPEVTRELWSCLQDIMQTIPYSLPIFYYCLHNIKVNQLPSFLTEFLALKTAENMSKKRGVDCSLCCKARKYELDVNVFDKIVVKLSKLRYHTKISRVLSK